MALLLGRIVADPFRPSPSSTRRPAWALCLFVLGLCWAMVGVAAHLVRLSQMTGANAPSDGMAAFGSLLDVAAFIIPGLLLALLGLVVRWRARRARRRAAEATSPGA